MRTAQIQSQVIVYILAVIIMGMILIFGYKALAGMNGTAEKAQLIQFRSDLKTQITSIGIDFGTSKLKSFSVPQKYRQVCFVNLDHTDGVKNDVIEQMKDIKTSAIIKDAVKDMVSADAARENVFLCPPCADQEYVGNITILDDQGADTVFRCFNVSQGSLSLRIEGLGNMARIS